MLLLNESEAANWNDVCLFVTVRETIDGRLSQEDIEPQTGMTASARPVYRCREKLAMRQGRGREATEAVFCL